MVTYATVNNISGLLVVGNLHKRDLFGIKQVGLTGVHYGNKNKGQLLVVLLVEVDKMETSTGLCYVNLFILSFAVSTAKTPLLNRVMLTHNELCKLKDLMGLKNGI